MTQQKANLAWYVSVHDDYGQKKIRATIVQPQPNGELLNVGSYSSEPGYEYGDFSVSAYLGWNSTLGTGNKNPGEIWALTHEFQPHLVERLETAENMVKVFRKLRRGLEKANNEFGYVRDGDYFAYLTRIAAILGIRTFYVRNHRDTYDNTGEMFRRVDAPSLAYWVTRCSELAESNPGALQVRV